MTLQEAKDQIAREYRYESWESLRHCNSMNYGQWETFSDRAAELYAKEIADKAWEAPLDAAMNKFEEAKKSAGTLKDIVFLDAALAVLDTLKSGKSPDKSTFMKSLFP